MKKILIFGVLQLFSIQSFPELVTSGKIVIRQELLNGDSKMRQWAQASNWKWVPLFNHRQTSGDLKIAIDETKLFSKKFAVLNRLTEALNNEENGKNKFEYVSQAENDQLLLMIVNYQLKSHDLLSLIEMYQEKNNKKIHSTCSDIYKCEDGRKVLFSFYEMQSRLEEIESGNIDTNFLPESVRESFSLTQFSCYYMGFQDLDYIQEYMEKKYKEMRSIFKTVSNNEISTVVEYLQEKFINSNDNKKKVRVYPDDIIARIYGNEGRLIVVNCLKKQRIDNWKRVLRLNGESI